MIIYKTSARNTRGTPIILLGQVYTIGSRQTVESSNDITIFTRKKKTVVTTTAGNAKRQFVELQPVP